MSDISFYKSFSFDSPQKAFSILPSRPERSGKWDFGRLLCVVGSHGMAGAAILCAKAAYRSGVGLVEVVTCESNRVILQTALPEAIVTVYDTYPDNSLLADAVSRADAIVCGCGMGITPNARRLLSDVLHLIEGRNIPLVLDADALNLLSANPSLLKYARGAVLTPHVREMSRLIGIPSEKILVSPASYAHEFAKRYGVICVLKDHCTAVSDGGSEMYVNNTGNSGMATGGSGDVLSGILGGLLSQHKNASVPLRDLVCLGVYLHGMCGDAAAAKLSEYSLIASDLISALPSVLARYAK